MFVPYTHSAELMKFIKKFDSRYKKDYESRGSRSIRVKKRKAASQRFAGQWALTQVNEEKDQN